MDIKNQPYLHYRNDLYILYIINSILTQRNLAQPNERLLIAVSGGQDSICMIKIMRHLRSKWNWKLGIVNCDHGWSSISKLQSIFVSEIAQNLKIDYYQSIFIKPMKCEKSARRWRYESIQRIADYHKYTLILTAHNASDRIETLVYNISRGSGITGIQALNWIKYVYKEQLVQIDNSYQNKSLMYLNYLQNSNITYLQNKTIRIVRPFLSLTRTQIRKLVLNWKLSVWPDPSNNYCQLRRNFIRKHLLPYMRLYLNLNLDEVLSQWTELVNGENVYFSQLANLIRVKIEKIIVDEKGRMHIILNINMLSSLPIVLQRKIIQQSIQIHTHQKINYFQTEQIRLMYLCNTKKAIKTKYFIASSNCIKKKQNLYQKKLNFKTMKIYFLSNNIIIKYNF